MKKIIAVLSMCACVCRADSADLPGTSNLYEVVRHLYRWYLDEDDVARAKASKNFTFWIEPLNPKLDEGDRSRLARILLPQFDVSVKVKKTNYTIEEIGLDVISDTYKITNVERGKIPARPPRDAQVVDVAFKDMLEDLFRTRHEAVFPEGEFLMRLRTAVRKHLLSGGAQPLAGTQIVHLSPISPVANELWVYWETGRMLIRFAADIDLANPAVWEYEDLHVETYDIEKQVVVSFDEAPGSNRFLTRDQVGRVIYNCMVFGRRVEFEPIPLAPGEEAAQEGR